MNFIKLLLDNVIINVFQKKKKKKKIKILESIIPKVL